MRLQVNLLPAQYRPKPPLRLWPIILTVVLMLNLIGISSYWVTLQVEIADAQSEIASLENELAILKRRVAEQEWKALLSQDVASKSAHFEGIDEENILWAPLLRAFERAMVTGMKIDAFNTSPAGDVSMAGSADSLSVVADFLGSLEQETGLPNIRFHQAVPGGTFQITFGGWTGRNLEQETETEEEDTEEETEEEDNE